MRTGLGAPRCTQQLVDLPALAYRISEILRTAWGAPRCTHLHDARNRKTKRRNETEKRCLSRGKLPQERHTLRRERGMLSPRGGTPGTDPSAQTLRGQADIPARARSTTCRQRILVQRRYPERPFHRERNPGPESSSRCRSRTPQNRVKRGAYGFGGVNR